MELNIVFSDFSQTGRLTLSNQKPYGTLWFKELKNTQNSIHRVYAFILPTPYPLHPLSIFSCVPLGIQVILYNAANTLFPASKSAFLFLVIHFFFSVAKNY